MNGPNSSDLRNPHPFPLMLSPLQLNNKPARLSLSCRCCCCSPCACESCKRKGKKEGRELALIDETSLESWRGDKMHTRLKQSLIFTSSPSPYPNKVSGRLTTSRVTTRPTPISHFLHVGILVLVNIWGPVVVITRGRYMM